LVGRSGEVLSIERALGSLKAGRGHVLMVTGEPGIGKSTLARVAAHRARAEGIPVFWGFAWEAGGAPGYWPWTQLLGSLVSERQPDDSSLAGLEKLLSDTAVPVPVENLQPGQARFQLMEAVRRLLDEVSRQTPVVLVMEDLHAADSDSLHLMHYVCRHVAGMPVLVVGTFREAEARSMPSGDPLWRVCRDAEVLRPGCLDRDSIREFLRLRGGAAVTNTDVEKLYAITEGNPLFLTELVALLDRTEVTGARLPATIQQVIRQQVAMLPPEAIQRLTEASVLGREFDPHAIAAISDRTAAEAMSELGTAVESGMLRKTATGAFRFSHVLYRDVLYQDIDPATRASIHLRYARYLGGLIDAGHEERWTELARHLDSAGSDHRSEAIVGWRRAARRSLERLAFDDAADSLQNALRSLGDMSECEPTERYRLLLECAEAMILAGDTGAGQRHCRDAFEIARALDEASLMAEAALTWGGAIVAAKVDPGLVSALRTSLAALPKSDIAMRAQVQARLAGALQPAPDPNEPIEMARDAIAMARSTGDDKTVYRVLRSAISALMDFALPEERIPLNEEFGALAEQFGDVPGQFRSQLRLMIDACEAADRDKMDSAVDRIHRLSEKIGLPHYRWRAASARAMQATIDGNFTWARELLDSAQGYAEEVGDVEAKVALPAQRYAILIEWEGDCGETLDQIHDRLRDAYATGMAGAKEYITPFVVCFGGSSDSARRLLADREAVDRLLAGGDRYSVCRVGEIAAAAGRTDVAGQALDTLGPHAAGCATAGLLGSTCVGPTALSMGRIEMSLGRFANAKAHLRQALDIAETMRSPLWVARVAQAMAEASAQAGDDDDARRFDQQSRELIERLGLRPERRAPTMPSGTTVEPADALGETFSLERAGELWRVSYNGRAAMFKPSRGFEMLAMLVTRPNADVHVLELSGDRGAAGRGDSGPALDQKARSQYEARIGELRAELEEAEEFGDRGRAEAARAEIDFIGRELARAFGIGGRARPVADAAERARVNVRRRLKDAIDRVSRQHSDAGRYLKNTVTTGTYCRYTPM